MVERLYGGWQEASGEDIVRQASTTEVKELKSEARELKECVAELTLENRLLKKSMIGNGGGHELKSG